VQHFSDGIVVALCFLLLQVAIAMVLFLRQMQPQRLHSMLHSLLGALRGLWVSL
jgi:hypothetical protein